MTLKRLLEIVAIEPPVQLYLFWLSYFAIGWGILTILITDIFAVSNSYTTFKAFDQDPIFWFLLYSGIGLYGLFACASNNRIMLFSASMGLLALWIFTVACLVTATGTFATGSFVYTTYALMAGWCAIRIGNHSWNG